MINSQRVVSAGSNVGEYIICDAPSVIAFLRKLGQRTRRVTAPTIVEIDWLRINRSLNHSELHLVELLAFETYPY